MSIGEAHFQPEAMLGRRGRGSKWFSKCTAKSRDSIALSLCVSLLCCLDELLMLRAGPKSSFSGSTDAMAASEMPTPLPPGSYTFSPTPNAYLQDEAPLEAAGRKLQEMAIGSVRLYLSQEAGLTANRHLCRTSQLQKSAHQSSSKTYLSQLPLHCFKRAALSMKLE